MPKTTYLTRAAPSRIATLLFGTANISQVPQYEMARIAGVSINTIRNRREAPENITLGEMLKLGKALGVPIEDIRQTICY